MAVLMLVSGAVFATGNSNNSDNSTTNVTNTANGGQGGSGGSAKSSSNNNNTNKQAQGQAQIQGQSAVGEVTVTNEHNTPRGRTVYDAPALAGLASGNCTGGSRTFSLPGFGVGSSDESAECNLREAIKVMAALGMTEQARDLAKELPSVKRVYADRAAAIAEAARPKPAFFEPFDPLLTP